MALDDDPRNCQLLPDIPRAMRAMAGAYYDGTVRYCGRLKGLDAFSNCEEFDPESGLWYVIADLREDGFSTASSIIDGQWFITGGRVCVIIVHCMYGTGMPAYFTVFFLELLIISVFNRNN